MEDIILEHFQEYKRVRNYLLIFNCQLIFILVKNQIMFFNLKVYSDGQIFLNGLEEGVVINYYAPEKKYREFFRHGLKEGLATVYDERGNLFLEEYYLHGKLTNRITYDREGKIRTKI